MLAQREYKRRHDNVAKYVHWRLCGKYELDKANKWYDHKPDGVIENTNYKILWDVMIQCDREIEARRPDIVVVDKQKRVKIIDIAIPGDVRVYEKEIEKIDKYKPLKDEIARLWQMQKVTIIPIVVGALGAITNRLGNFMQEIGIEICIEHVQKTALLGTARVLRLVKCSALVSNFTDIISKNLISSKYECLGLRSLAAASRPPGTPQGVT
ncbi:uncharacterized protein LOC134764236 [Penaeus indicus]|uniref:uncharacterized protein LOC134764236 n=1 Tax=Penaeus indicus TaxID=29960 RepID=UPI00300C573D